MTAEQRETQDLPTASRRVLEGARAAGLDIEIVTHPASTRTAQEAAEACGCAVGQIVKSLVFRGRASGRAYLLLVSGANRVDEAQAAAAIGEAIVRPDAAFVREATGFAIGGVSPFGASQPLATFYDPDLLGSPAVWAAAGTPLTVFRAEPAALIAATGAKPLR